MPCCIRVLITAGEVNVKSGQITDFLKEKMVTKHNRHVSFLTDQLQLQMTACTSEFICKIIVEYFYRRESAERGSGLGRADLLG